MYILWTVTKVILSLVFRIRKRDVHQLHYCNVTFDHLVKRSLPGFSSIQSELTLEQHEFELYRPTFMWLIFQ